MEEYKIPEYLYVIMEVHMGQSDIYIRGYRVRDYKPWDYNDSADQKVKVPKDIKTKEELIRFTKEKFKDAISIEIDKEYYYN